MQETLTVNQAFIAMTEFLKGQYKRTKSDDIGALLGDIRMIGDAQTADPAAWADWLKCVEITVHSSADS
jgi:hypothetical protein